MRRRITTVCIIKLRLLPMCCGGRCFTYDARSAKPMNGWLRGNRIMLFKSTRGQAPLLGFADVLLQGLAKGGGLYIPESVPVFSRADLKRLRLLSYPALADEITRHFVVGDLFSAADNRRLTMNAYASDVWESSNVVPVVKLFDRVYLAELFRGPTLAFKDLAMQLLALQMEMALARRGEKLVLYGATSGDTGPAAIEAFAGKRNIELFMSYPKNGTSDTQRRQMTTVLAKNIHVMELEGTFDDCQDTVKALGYGAINSINMARIVAQIIYYYWSYFRATRSNDEEVMFSVPTGNSGNMYACVLAKRTGLPVKKIIVATNENDVVARCIKTGVYEPTGVVATSSPSMDIQSSSNFERLVHDVVGDAAEVARLYGQLKTEKKFSVDPGLFRDLGIVAGASDTSQRHQMIKHIFDVTGKREIIDTHTANGLVIGLPHYERDVPLICMATASPVKFRPVIEEVLGVSIPLPERFADIGEREERFETLPADAWVVDAYIKQQLLEAA